MMSDKRIEIVELSQEDLDAVAEIEKETFSLPWSRQSFADAIEDSFGLFLVRTDYTIHRRRIMLSVAFREIHLRSYRRLYGGRCYRGRAGRLHHRRCLNRLCDVLRSSSERRRRNTCRSGHSGRRFQRRLRRCYRLL